MTAIAAAFGCKINHPFCVGAVFKRFGLLVVAAVVLAAWAVFPAAESHAAREASFVNPAATSGKAEDEAVVVEPKADTDIGDSIVNISRRTTLFFVNKTIVPIAVEGVALSGDGNVKNEIVSDDCSKSGQIAASSRCSVVVEVTPLSSGTWTVELTMTHKGAGRLARARIIGKTSNPSASSEKKDAGLALSTKDVKPVDFGAVELNGTKVVRSALMINDSPETITILSIDVIAADNGLQRLDQGCEVDMELKPAESCPVTLIWKPETKGVVSTDLIVRHTGRLGFAVVPLRGSTQGADSGQSSSGGSVSGGTSVSGSGKGGALKPPPLNAADEVEKALSGKMQPISSDMIPASAIGGDGKTEAKKAECKIGSINLIGTIGNRAILLKPDGKTAIAEVGEEVECGDSSAKLLGVTPKGAELSFEGKKLNVVLKASDALTGKAAQASAAKLNPQGGDGKVLPQMPPQAGAQR